MPNEKINFSSDSEERKEKINYVKNKDLLGFDTSNFMMITLNLHKIKEFGSSENLILMDDDYFIGKPLQKSDLFYEENGKVFLIYLLMIICIWIKQDFYKYDQSY